MFHFWQRTLLFLLILILLSLLIWAMAGALPAALFFSLIVLVRHAFHLRYLAALEYWLEEPETHVIPEGSGLWEEIFARLNRMMRKHRKEREQRMAALRHLEQATSALPEGVVILDDADHIEWCNPIAEQHFGLDGVRDVGQQITYLARQPEFVQYLAARDFSNVLILRTTRHDGQTLSIKLIPYGGNKQLLISRDITRFERIETMRRDFVANVSHEMRTPLTVVNGFVETLSAMPSLEPQAARLALQRMGEQTQRMERLVSDLLTLSRLDDTLNALQEETVDIPALLDDVLQEGRALSASRHHLQLKLECTCRILGNREELRSAFANLISNAIRYTPDGGSVTIALREQDGQPVFSVQDSGIGIAAEHIPRLTERFYRVDQSRSSATGGTGLGLAIVKHVANRHQATLEIKSEEGKGSTFSIIFPVRRRIME